MSGFDLKNLEKVLAGNARIARHSDLYLVDGEEVFPLEDDVYAGLVAPPRWKSGNRKKPLTRYCAKRVLVPVSGTYRFRDYYTNLQMVGYFALGWNDVVIGSPLRNEDNSALTGIMTDTMYVLERRIY